jgi:hypothetical protein
MKKPMNKPKMFQAGMLLILILFAASFCIHAQELDGIINGKIVDSTNSKGLARVRLTIKNEDSGAIMNSETTPQGFFEFPHVWSGTYRVEADLKGFKKEVSEPFAISANQTVRVNLALHADAATAEVQGGSASHISSSTILNLMEGSILADLPTPAWNPQTPLLSFTALFPGVVTSPGSMIKSGNVNGGLRSDSNNFVLDGVDNTALNTGGATLPPILDSVASLNIQTASANSSLAANGASQIMVTTKTASNELHGSAYLQGTTRQLNALSPSEKAAEARGDLNPQKRFDFLQGGATLGGAIIKEKLFGYAAYQYQFQGLSPKAYYGQSITNEGLQTIEDDIKGLSSNNVDIIKNDAIWPKALVPNGNYATVVGSDGVSHQVELGDLSGTASRYYQQRNWMTNVDYQTEFQQIHGRFQFFNQSEPDINERFANSLYTGDKPISQWQMDVSQSSPIKPTFLRETRLIFRRFDQKQNTPSSLTTTPTYMISSMGLFMGADTESPQSRKENLIQFINNLTVLKRQHTYRFGLEYRKWDAPTISVYNSRGSYDWTSLDSFLKDKVPTGTYGATRGVGTSNFQDSRMGIYAYFQDEYKLRPRFNLNWGFRYEYSGLPRDAELQDDNEVASIPGTLDFRTPTVDMNNIAPRIGFSYDLSGKGKTILRGGYSMNYDTMAGDYFRLSMPPQFQQVLTPLLACTELDTSPNYCRNHSPVGPPNARGFLVSGGLPNTAIAPTTVKQSRAMTTSFIPDMVSPTIYNWNLTLQHELRNNWMIETSYIGSRGLHLPVLNNRNSGNPIPENQRLPTYFSVSEVPSNASGAASLADILTYSGSGQRVLSSYGFTNDVLAYDPLGISRHQAGSVFVQNRGIKGLFLRGGYTFGHTTDNSSGALYAAGSGPSRAENYFNYGNEMANSALNRPHHFSLAWTYAFPKFAVLPEWANGVLGGFQLNGIYLLESGQPITPLSGTDVNNNFDSSSDRVAVNPNGDANVGTSTSYVVRDSAGNTAITSVAPSDLTRIVGYVAVNPNAKWVATRLGGQTSSTRNTLTLPRSNCLNFSVSKKFAMSERMSLQFHADFLNALNHAQYSMNWDPQNSGSSLLQKQTFLTNLYNSYATASSANFLDNSSLTSSGRMLQVGIRFYF